MSRIPKTVHFIFGMAPDFGGKPWGMTHHCCVMSAIKHIKPDKVLFHYGTEPTGAWWKADEAARDARPGDRTDRDIR